jgi:rare lipoprotein A
MRIYAAPMRFASVLALIAITLIGCARKSRAHVPPAPAPAPIPATPGATETGIASWYGKPYDGRRAASGEIYDMQQLTAAHRTLPFNTWVEVTDLDNGKQVNVRINDRGPFIDGRIIDLSLAAARTIEMVGPGTARVRITVIAPPIPDPAPPVPLGELYAVQAASFSDPDRARSFAVTLENQYKDAVVIESFLEGQTVWRVLVARNLSLDDANRLSAQVKQALGEALVVKNP